MMPVYYGTRDPRLFVIKVVALLIGGDTPQQIVSPASCYLKIRRGECKEMYVESLDNKIWRQKLLESMVEVMVSPNPV